MRKFRYHADSTQPALAGMRAMPQGVIGGVVCAAPVEAPAVTTTKKNGTLVLVPFNGELLALSHEQFAEARTLGEAIAGSNAKGAPGAAPLPGDEPLLTAEQMEARTGTPATWFLEQARKDAVPHVRLGKYVRFRFSEVCDAYERKPK